jgi:NDP-sugar pyrophosphorylase family protein
MLEHIIERAKLGGIQEFAIAINYLGDMIEEYFGDGSKMQVQIRYLHEDSPLGTAGAIGLLDPRPSEPILVCNGDVLTDIRCGDLLDYHSKHGAAATMAVRVHEWQHPFGVVKTKGVEIAGFEEKPITRSHINAGIYVLAPAAIEALRSGEHCDMPSLFEMLIKRGEKAIVYPTHERWLDMGRPVDYEQANGHE